MMNSEERMETLKDYFSKETSVVMAYVFGSYAKERVMSESDFDIAAYFKPEGREIEHEEYREYPDEDRIWDDVRKIVDVNTDFVVMNRCPSTLALDILDSGKEIIVKDDSIRLEFYLITSSVAEDFMEFAKDFYAIRQRSALLSKVDKHNLMRRKVFLENEIKDIDHFKGLDFNTYKTDKNKRRIVERWIEVIVTASIDIAKIVLASEKKDIPRTYNDTLEVLGFMIGLDAQASKKFSKFAELRNIIAHEYLDILYARVKKFIDEAEPLCKELIDFVGKILEK